ncbi:MAG: hypothetical protein Q6373_014715 [Candidatus Sigynarchaeota archaeon]
MERPMDGKAPETRCPQCGLVIKLASLSVETCPVCGAKLPAVPAAKKSPSEPKGPIMLEQALFKSPRVKESWAPREVLSVIMLTFFVVLMVNYLIVAAGEGIITSGQFDPVLYFSINLAGILVGIAPLAYVLANKTGIKKLALHRIPRAEWLWAIVLGITCGIGLYALNYMGQVINEVTGLDSLVTTTAGEQAEKQYSEFMLVMENRLFLLVPVAVAQVLGELFYRGTVLNGIIQWFQKRVPPLSRSATRLRAWVLSVLFGTLFDFSLFFNLTSIVPSLFLHALVGLLFILTRNVQAGMIAQLMYIILLIIV